MSESDIIVQQLKAEDWRVLRWLCLSALQECEGNFTVSYEEASYKDTSYWVDLVSGDDRAVFVLYDADIAIGVSTIMVLPDDLSAETGLMAMSFITPDYRGRGFSSLLYKARIDWARIHSAIKKLVISHREGNEASRRAIERHGFRYVKTETLRFGDGVETLDHHYEMVFEDKL